VNANLPVCDIAKHLLYIHAHSDSVNTILLFFYKYGIISNKHLLDVR